MRLHPIICIEGPDACGKTTWAREFCRIFSGRYIHLTLRQNMLEHQIASLTLAQRLSEEQPVVIDRHWPSEQIYSGVYRGGTSLRAEGRILDELMTAMGVFHVGCLMSTPIRMALAHREASGKRPEMYEADERILQVANGYHDWWHGSKWCQYDIGHCQAASPMAARTMAATLYDRDVHGQPENLPFHIRVTHEMARVWREHKRHEDPSKFKRLRQRDWTIALMAESHSRLGAAS